MSNNVTEQTEPTAVESLLKGTQPGPWEWSSEDASSVILHCKGDTLASVLVCSRCAACQRNGFRCTTPTAPDMALIAAAPDLANAVIHLERAARALLHALDRYEDAAGLFEDDAYSVQEVVKWSIFDGDRLIFANSDKKEFWKREEAEAYLRDVRERLADSASLSKIQWDRAEVREVRDGIQDAIYDAKATLRDLLGRSR